MISEGFCNASLLNSTVLRFPEKGREESVPVIPKHHSDMIMEMIEPEPTLNSQMQ